MTDTDIEKTENGNGKSPVTKGDIINQDIDKVFPDGPSVPEEQTGTDLALVARRPTFAVTAEELDGAKMLAMAGPFVPAFVRGNPGYCFGVLQLAKRYSKYDSATNSWVSFDPIAIASQTYIVEGRGGTASVGYTSQFIGAIIDAFVPWASRMRYRYDGEGQTRRCTATARLRGDPEPFEYTTPQLKDITPKNSPLWATDPDRQLAYYARRAWARLFTPGVLLGVYDVDELEGRAHQEAHKIRDEGTITTLHDRLAASKQAAGDAVREGFRPEAAEELPRRPNKEPQERAKPTRGGVIAPKAQKRASEPPKGKVRVVSKAGAAARVPADSKIAKVARGGPERGEDEKANKSLPRLPTNAREYAQHVKTWLAELDTEEAIASRWRREMNLRNLCGVIEEERNAIRAFVDQRIMTLRSS